MTAHVRAFVFGLGYSANRFAAAVSEHAEWVGGTVRTIDKAVSLAAEPRVRPYVFDGSSPGVGVAEAVKVATHLLISIPPGENGDPVLRWHRDTIRAASALKWIGYLSTVGVYGDRGGGWVDELAAPTPVSERGKRRVAAEAAWTKAAAERGVPLAIMRIASIYGPGRNALVKLASGAAHRIVKPGQVFNRIHVDDLLVSLVAAADKEAAGIFNIADDEPAPPQDVIAFAASLMGIEPPMAAPFREAELSPMERSFYAENKRVSNGRMKRELGLSLRYPTYREGLTVLWDAGNWR